MTRRATDAQVLVLGGGISGCLVASLLHDRGIDVAIVEQQPHVMNGASRWNDGKLHLGFTFTGTPSTATAALMQRGASMFLPSLGRALGMDAPADWFTGGVTYLVDRDTMVPSDVLWERAQAIGRLVDEAAEHDAGLRHYLEGQPRLERLDPAEAKAATRQQRVIAAWRTPERHISSGLVADALADTIDARGVPVLTGRVTEVRRENRHWCVRLADASQLAAPAVVNCLWEERSAIDRALWPSDEPVSIRYKSALFGTSVDSLAGVTPSTRILGRFGDVVAFPGGRAYLSWYPAGLAASSDDGVPPKIVIDEAAVASATVRGLGWDPSLLQEPGGQWRVEGGYVVAWGRGDIDTIDSPLHERHRPAAVVMAPGYVTVDTGKYTLAPMLAERAVALLLQSLPSLTRPRSRPITDDP